jgi:phage terminase small subunit
VGEVKLTEKQKRFIDFYIETGNASEACRLAGYAGKDYNSLGSQNYAKLRKYIDIKLKEKDDARIASQDEVLFYLSSVLRGEEKEECIVVESMGQGCGSNARIVKKQVTPTARLEAAKQLAKIYGLSTKIEKDKLDIDKQKLEIEKEKLALQKESQKPPEQSENDGFIEALNSIAGEVWSDDEADGQESNDEVQELLE